MDQNPIKVTKLKYRNKLLSNVVAQDNVSVHDSLKNHSIRDAILLLKVAWDELSTTVLQKAWSKILNWDDKDYDDEDNTPLSELQASKDIYDEMIAEAQLLLSKLGKDCTLTIEEIEEWNSNFDENENEDECDIETSDEQSSEEESPPQPAVSYGDAINAVNLFLKWADKDMEYSNKHLSNLLELRSDIVKNHFTKPQEQMKLDSYFSLEK